MKRIAYASSETVFGKAKVCLTRRGVCLITFDEAGWGDFMRGLRPERRMFEFVEDEGACAPLFSEIERFFDGKLRAFTTPVDFLFGTDFQKGVWRGISKIGYGKTKTYGELARELGRPAAYRAVGGACGANPVPIVVPCHRVVAADGGLGGFGLGLPMKEKLLAMERAVEAGSTP